MKPAAEEFKDDLRQQKEQKRKNLNKQRRAKKKTGGPAREMLQSEVESSLDLQAVVDREQQQQRQRAEEDALTGSSRADRLRTLARLRAQHRQQADSSSSANDSDAATTSSSTSRSSSSSTSGASEQPPPQQREPAFGHKRSYARAQALPEGLWEELKRRSLAEPCIIKIGRSGVTRKLVQALQLAWRGREVVKLRIHDDKSSRKANLPRLNQVLAELEEQSGGVLIDASGSAIWMYRGVDYKLPKLPPPPPEPAPEILFQAEYTPRGTWQVAGVQQNDSTAEQVGDTNRSDRSSDGASSSSSSNESDGSLGVYSVGPADAPAALLVLPDMFDLRHHSGGLLQVCDRLAAAGFRVVLPDLLGSRGAWPLGGRWPPEKRDKVVFTAWFREGPGSWQQQAQAVQQQLLQLQQGRRQGAVGAVGLGWGAMLALRCAGVPQGSAADAARTTAKADGKPQKGAASSSTNSGGPSSSGSSSSSSSSSSSNAAAAAAPQAAVGAAACMSPQFMGYEEQLAAQLACPVYIAAARYDPMDKIQTLMQLRAEADEAATGLAAACMYKRYGKVRPGFLTHSADFGVKANAVVASQVVDDVAGFLREHLLPGGQ